MGREPEKPRRKPTGDQEGSQEERFLKAFDEYVDALYRHSSFRLADKERSIELVHDTFTKVWGYIRAGHTIDSYKPFLYKVLNNLVIDEYRRKKDVSLDSLLAEEGKSESSFDELHEGSIEEVVFGLDAKKAVVLIHELPHTYREVITLRYIDGLGPKEISVLIEETENVVSVRIHRALRLLRERIELLEEKSRRKRNV